MTASMSTRYDDCPGTDNTSGELLEESKNGNVTGVAIILSGCNGTDINTVDNDGKTPLILASQKGHSKVVELLLHEEDIEVNKVDSGGKTPLIWASQEGHSNVVELLLKGEDIEVF